MDIYKLSNDEAAFVPRILRPLQTLMPTLPTMQLSL